MPGFEIYEGQAPTPPGPEAWRAPYQADGFTPGSPSQSGDENRWQWQADSPLVPGAPGTGGTGTGNSSSDGSGQTNDGWPAPVWDPTQNGTVSLPSWDQPTAGTTSSIRDQLNLERAIVEAALDYNTVGVPGNIFMGSVGGLIGGTAVPRAISLFNRPLAVQTGAALEAGGAIDAGAAFVQTAKSSPAGWKASMLKGASVSAGMMVLNHYADNFLSGGEYNHGNGISNSINSALVPIAFLSSNKLGFKKAAGVATLTWVGGRILGQMLDEALPESEHPRYSRWFRQGSLESALLSAEFMIPMGTNWKGAALKAGIMAATWAGGRLANGLLEDPPPADIKEHGDKLLFDDFSERTVDSMNAAIDKYIELGSIPEPSLLTGWVDKTIGNHKAYVGEAALNFLKNDWLTEDPDRRIETLSFFRGAIIRCAAFAESRLSHGTRLISDNESPNYILEGMNLDLTGKAALELWRAKLNVENAKEETLSLMGMQFEGTVVDEGELTDLDRVTERIERSEEKIYGRHDIAKAAGELSDLWRKEPFHAAKLVQDAGETLAVAKANSRMDQRLTAKLYRDLALLYMSNAMNTVESNPSAAAAMLYGDDLQGRQALDAMGNMRGYDGALDVIRLATELDPSNADLAEINAIAQQLLNDLPAEYHRS